MMRMLKVDNSESCEITRRHALHIAVQGGLVLVGTILSGQEAEGAAVWERAGTISQFQIGVPKKVILSKGNAIYVLRQSASQWIAINPRCTHEGAEIRWNPETKRFVCPLHGATFGTNGQNQRGPARRPLELFPTQVKGKDVQVKFAGDVSPGGKKGGKRREEENDEREHERDEKHHGKEKESD